MKKYDNYKSNLKVLRTAKDQDLTNQFVIGGIIDKFYIQFELGWKVLKELLIYEGVSSASSGSPREIIKQAYKYYGCMEEETWLNMLSDRNDTSHIYNENAAMALVEKTMAVYIDAFEKLEDSIEERYGDIIEGLQ